VTAALGATALFAPGAANAANFEVNTTADHATDPAPACQPLSSETDCTLRDAVSDANSNPGDDTITFASGVTGTITLDSEQGQININANGGGLAINGPGAGTLEVSADDNSRIFNVYTGSYPVSISGLSFTHGYSGGGDGGALYTSGGTNVTVADSVFRNNVASDGGAGGAIGANGALTVTGSQFQGNSSTYDNGGAIFSQNPLNVRNSTISGNSADQNGGGIASFGKYAQMDIRNTTISDNSARSGGGIGVFQLYKYSEGSPNNVKHALKSQIVDTTISGNKAPEGGGGLNVGWLGDGDHFTVTHSTISGNDAQTGDATGLGGGVKFGNPYYSVRNGGEGYGAPVDGEFHAIDSTISGNTADLGGGVATGSTYDGEERSAPANETRPVIGPDGSVEFENSTIASNNASSGGGVYLNGYDSTPYDQSGPTYDSPTIALTSTILADNTAGGAPNDAARADGSQSGGLDTTFSLVENPGGVPVQKSPAGSTLIGVDPQLGGLANNGGATQTQLPAVTSPVVDQGKAPARLDGDQRGHVRTVDSSGVANAASGDGTDIGAVETDSPPQQQQAGVAPSQAVLGDRTPPKIGLKVPKQLSIQQLIDGFNVRVSCNEVCSMTFRLFGSAPTGTLHSSGYNFRLLNRKIKRKAGTRKVHLKPCVAGSSSKRRTHVCRKRITAALFAKPQKTFKVKLIVAAKDNAGNVSHKKKFIRVHR
jgi:hypothetical protein